MSATEEVLEQLPEAVVEDTAEVITVVRNNPLVLAGVLLVGGAVGGIVGYKVAQSRLKMRYEELVREEVQQAREYYSRLHIKSGAAADPQTLLEELHGNSESARAAADAHAVYSGQVSAPVQTEEELLAPEEQALYEKNNVPKEPETELRTVTRNAFTDAASVVGLDMEQEILNRVGDKPYVITKEEYLEGRDGFEQIELSYYQGDDVLADEREQPIPDEETTVGNDNLTRFGHGSEDPNIVYVRNETLEADFEITRSFGSYAQEVLGFDSSETKGLKHSAGHKGIRKFREHRD
jgi:hypothetical protein